MSPSPVSPSPAERSHSSPRRWPAPLPIAAVGVALGLISLLLLLVAGLGSRWELWSFRAGLQMLRWAAYGGLAAALVSLVGWVLTRNRRGSGFAVLGLLLGLGVAAIPWGWQRTASGVPPIHDITTDTEDPPEFRAILPRRVDAPNPAEYGGSDVARQQREAYPDIAPATLDIPAAAAYSRALTAARAMGWAIVAADSSSGRIEATDRTRWFGFRDDIVVRIKSAAQGSRVDVRSVSRVGKSDVGTNARRIRDFLRRLQRS